jgi:hypothetical protein
MKNKHARTVGHTGISLLKWEAKKGRGAEINKLTQT